MRKKRGKIKIYRIFVFVALVMLLGVTEAYGLYSIQHTVQPLASETYAQVNDARIAYFIVGEGEPLILHAGFGMSMQDWDPLLIEQLSHNYKVIIFDSRGVGKSTGVISNLTLKQMAQDSMGVLDALGIQRAHMLGWSLGSMVVQQIAQSYPERVDKIILAATDPGGSETVEAGERVSHLIDKNMDKDWEHGIVPLLFPHTPEGVKASLAYISRRNLAIARGTMPNDYGLSQEIKTALASVISNKEEGDARYRSLKNITAPTLIMGGEADVLLPFENDKRTASEITHAQLVGFPNTGHGFLFHEPIKCAQTVHQFLSSI